MLKLTRVTDLRPSTVHIGLLESTGSTGLKELTERIGSLKLKEPICLQGLTRVKGLQTLTGHTGALKFQYTDNERGNWSSTIENDTASMQFLEAFKFWRQSVIWRDLILPIDFWDGKFQCWDDY